MGIVNDIVSGLTSGIISQREVDASIASEERVIKQQTAHIAKHGNGGAVNQATLERHQDSLANLRQARREAQ